MGGQDRVGFEVSSMYSCSFVCRRRLSRFAVGTSQADHLEERHTQQGNSQQSTLQGHMGAVVSQANTGTD